MSRFKPLFDAIRHAENHSSQLLASQKIIQNYDISDCMLWARAVKSHKDKANDPNFLPEMIAVISHAVFLTTQHKPRITQILSLLTLLEPQTHGRLAELATGEGKSLIVAMLAIIHVLQGKKVDIVTSSSVLACRETIAQKSLFDCFDMSVSHNCSQHTGNSYQDGPKSCYLDDIVYGDVGNFQFDLLRHEYKGYETRAERQYDVVIVDEVDSMLIDESMKIAALGSYKPAMEHLEPLLVAIWVELNRLLHEESDSDKLISLLTEYTLALLEHPDSPIIIPQHLKVFAQLQAPYWARSAVIAYSAYELNKHYVLANDEHNQVAITPVDYQNTGTLHGNSAWDDGLHQFLQLKHGIPLTAENLTASFISNVSYFKRYGKNIFGLTGTLGNRQTQSILTTLYPLDVKFVPTFCDKQFKEIPGLLADDEPAWLSAIVTSVQHEIARHRAVLIICESILNVAQIEEALKSQGVQAIRRYTRADTDERDAITTPLSSKEVIIATNLAGRGTDIKTIEEVEAQGGLHVLLTYLPDNLRVENQAFGRTSRQGHQGTAQLIVNKMDAINKLKCYFQEALCPTTIDELKKWRDQVDELHLSRMQGLEIEKILFKDRLFTQFCKLVQQLREQEPNTFKLDDIEERWGFWLKQVERTLSKEDLTEQDDILASFETLKAEIWSEYTQNNLKNPCQWIHVANHHTKKAEYELALAAFQRAISIDPYFAVQAYYNRAFVRILSKQASYKSLAVADLNQAKEILQDKLIPQLQTTLLQLNLLRSHDAEQSTFQQIQSKIKYYQQQIENIAAVIQKIVNYDGDLDVDYDASSPLANAQSSDHVILELHHSGLISLFSVKEVISEEDDDFGWFRRFAILILGVCQVVAGVFISATGNVYLGKALIEMGVSDMAFVVRSVLQNTNCSWSEYRSHKIISSAIILGTIGIDIVRRSKEAQHTVVKPTINKEAVLHLAKDKVVAALSTAAITETINYGVYQLEQAAIKTFKSDIESNVQSTVTQYFQNAYFINNLNRLLSADQKEGNTHYYQRLQALSIELINPRRDQFAAHSHAILKGILANQHPLLKGAIAFADLSQGIQQLMELCDELCKSYQNRVALLASDFVTDGLTVIDCHNEREALCQHVINLLTRAMMTTTHHQLAAPVVDLTMNEHLSDLTKKMQTVVHGSIQSAIPTEAEMARCHEPQVNTITKIENLAQSISHKIVANDQNKEDDSHALALYGKMNRSPSVQPLFSTPLFLNGTSKLDFLYRGESRLPAEIFAHGFSARGNNLDLLSHTLPLNGEYSSSYSAYISTSASKEVAVRFPIQSSEPTHFLYEINPQPKAIDISKALKPYYAADLIEIEDWEYIVLGEKERAVPFKIRPQDIKGANPIELTRLFDMDEPIIDERKVQNTFIENPNYCTPKSVLMFQTVKTLSHTASAVGAIMDGINLFNSWQASQESGNYHILGQESARVAGGWSGAFIVGSQFAKISAASCASLGLYGPPVCGIIGGVSGSILGYTGASTMAIAAYDAVIKSSITLQQVASSSEMEHLTDALFLTPLHESPASRATSVSHQLSGFSAKFFDEQSRHKNFRQLPSVPETQTYLKATPFEANAAGSSLTDIFLP